MFRKLLGTQHSFKIKVGQEPSFAGHNLLTPYLVMELLQRLVASEAAVKQFEF